MKAFKKTINDIPVEPAHGGAGRRQVILSKQDEVTRNLEAATKGYLGAGDVFEWHSHRGVAEFFNVLKGKGMIEFEDGSRLDFTSGDLVYIPEDLEHRIVNNGEEECEFYFFRVFN